MNFGDQSQLEIPLICSAQTTVRYVNDKRRKIVLLITAISDPARTRNRNPRQYPNTQPKMAEASNSKMTPTSNNNLSRLYEPDISLQKITPYDPRNPDPMKIFARDKARNGPDLYDPDTSLRKIIPYDPKHPSDNPRSSW